MLVIGHQSLVIGCRSSVIGYLENLYTPMKSASKFFAVIPGLGPGIQVNTVDIATELPGFQLRGCVTIITPLGVGVGIGIGIEKAID